MAVLKISAILLKYLSFFSYFNGQKFLHIVLITMKSGLDSTVEHVSTIQHKMNIFGVTTAHYFSFLNLSYACFLEKTDYLLLIVSVHPLEAKS